MSVSVAKPTITSKDSDQYKVSLRVVNKILVKLGKNRITDSYLI
ncbi:MAG: hypothetical protein Barrevirus1_67 [Barrevirus sp.]|uniref:Uncharacterized protein n=1 Tax=Barrevirus sp. TaxID=2487763 RepID=A0A3G4ZPM6_9VIRU|nr:MAG: hypothetical protein Barrevirus1_67 [Barrevirus sp.]